MSWGITASISIELILSLIALSILSRPILNWFSINSPTDLTLLLPRLSMSSISPLPSLRSTIVLKTLAISSFVRVPWSSGVSRFSLIFILTLPTSDKSYLSLSKNRLVNRFVALSTVGGSPGLNILYISKRADVLSKDLSTAKVFRTKGLKFTLSIRRTGISSIFSTSNDANNSSVISSPASAKISPVEKLTISSEINFPNISSFEIYKSLTLSFWSRVLFVIFFPDSIITLLFFASIRSYTALEPFKFSEIKGFFQPSFCLLWISFL